MLNFNFKNPTRIIFGQGEIAKLSQEIPKNAKILMTYGGGSIKKNGVYQQVINALAGYDVIEFGGIEANPRYHTLMEAVNLVKKHDRTFLLAVGGGSVADGTKFIAAASHYQGENAWDLIAKGLTITKALPVGVVLTLPATGSEMNGGAVVTNEDLKQKRALKSPLLFPQFSILDPTVTYSLPLRQIGNGIVDAFTHVMEQYLTYPVGAHLQDRFAESILLTLIEYGPKTLKEPENYEYRANFVWSATMALNGLIGQGVVQDWATHMLSHPLTAIHNLDHAQTLAIILPNVMNKQRETKKEKLLQYAERIWHITEGDEKARIDQAIAKTREFFQSVGLKTSLSEFDISKNSIDKFIESLKQTNMLPVGERKDIDINRAREIYQDCV